MKGLFRAIICTIIVDFFYFSSAFRFTGRANTKMILAILGLIVFLFTSLKKREFKMSREMVLLIVLAAGVSLASFFSMTFNNTGDTTYVTYVVSMLVWFFAAYMVVVALKVAYGRVSIGIVADYIIVVSLIQCSLAVFANMFEPVNSLVLSIYPRGAGLAENGRLFGIGDTTCLDVGGIRYGIACVLSAYMLTKTESQEKDALIPWYLFAFMYITVMGNMVARTTTVGSGIGLAYILIYSISSTKVSYSKIKILGWGLAILVLIVSVFTWLYNTNAIMHDNLRFAFEGFFSLVETGRWQVNSNDVLVSMYVFPDNPKTWIIGDGYFNNPRSDPNFLGEVTHGFYMYTDVGYSRFLFYFGFIGLAIFSLMILYAGWMCMKHYPKDQFLFLALTLMNFIIWSKVATDCFFILGMFIALGYVLDYMSEPKEFTEEPVEET